MQDTESFLNYIQLAISMGWDQKSNGYPLHAYCYILSNANLELPVRFDEFIRKDNGSAFEHVKNLCKMSRQADEIKINLKLNANQMGKLIDRTFDAIEVNMWNMFPDSYECQFDKKSILDWVYGDCFSGIDDKGINEIVNLVLFYLDIDTFTMSWLNKKIITLTSMQYSESMESLIDFGVDLDKVWQCQKILETIERVTSCSNLDFYVAMKIKSNQLDDTDFGYGRDFFGDFDKFNDSISKTKACDIDHLMGGSFIDGFDSKSAYKSHELIIMENKKSNNS